jgi:hypothetical protein
LLEKLSTLLRKEVIMEKDIQKWLETLNTQRPELIKQMKEVSVKYPLVALAYKLQVALYVDRLLEDITIVGPIIGPIIDNKFVDHIRAKSEEARRKRISCFARAHNYTDGVDCLNEWVQDLC